MLNLFGGKDYLLQTIFMSASLKLKTTLLLLILFKAAYFIKYKIFLFETGFI